MVQYDVVICQCWNDR